MIKRFKPEDFEECLMSLPIDNWQFVDSETYYNEEINDLSRPKMLISHLDELKGLEVGQDLVIKAFSELSSIQDHAKVNKALKYVLKRSSELKLAQFKTLGCQLINQKNDPDLYPYLTALDATIILKSYIKERTLIFRDFANKEHNSFLKNNELFYEVRLQNIDFDFYTMDTITIKDNDKDMKFSYFLGLCHENKRIKTFRYALMLPSKRVIRCEKLENLLVDHPLEIDEHLKSMIKRIFYDELKTLKLSISQKVYTEKIFEDLIWSEIEEIVERGKYDQT